MASFPPFEITENLLGYRIHYFCQCLFGWVGYTFFPLCSYMMVLVKWFTLVQWALRSKFGLMVCDQKCDYLYPYAHNYPGGRCSMDSRLNDLLVRCLLFAFGVWTYWFNLVPLFKHQTDFFKVQIPMFW